ncbi:MAG TPA: transglycosylase SLT domain-containing protein [Burkholderiales bacterium]|nr:transglycosylase SLT domain-containing protein [Burkholderiales bacterium]
MKKLALLILFLLQACASQPVPEEVPESAAVPEPIAVPAPPPPPPLKPRVVAKPEPAKIEKPKPVIAKPKPLDAKPVVIEPPPEIVGIDRALEPTDLWLRIREGFAIPDLQSPLVRQKTKQYAARPEYLQRILDRSKLYLYHIVEEIEKRGLPTELALLPMVESAFNPMAYSRAHASGIWQFIPGTGRRFELEQNSWYDGRRDIVDSTNAALDYLTKLHKMYGDWQLALASYNWGENAVRKAIARNKAARKKTDYASLRMPKETRHYIPKLQALENIIADPAKFGVDLDAIPNQPYFAVINEIPDIDVHVAARLAEMPVEEFIALNPGFSRPLIRSSAARRIILPADKLVSFYDNLDQLDEADLVSWEVYNPEPGEKLEAIAKRFEMSLAELKRVNGIHTTSSRVPKELVVPKNGEAKATLADLPLMYAPPIPPRGTVRAVHVVRQGDTLGSIAARYRVSVDSLKRGNNVGRFLQVGQKIYIR